MRIVVDTNILFSALLDSRGAIGHVLLKSGTVFHFYSCTYMRNEIRRHWGKLKRVSRLNDEELTTAYDIILSRIRFINEDLISPRIWVEAENIVSGIDIDDIDFVALTRYLRGGLWTGDKVLYKGLKRAGFRHVYDTAELAALRSRLLKNRS